MVSQQFISVAGINLEVFEAGSGSPLLFLHGGQGITSDDPVLALLGEKYRVIAPSYPGFGKSELPDWLDSVSDIAHVTLELMDLRSLTHVDVVGCSIGGWLAAEMATMAPERFRRLVLAAPVGIKVGTQDKLDIPDIFAMPESRVAELIYCKPERAKIDAAALSDEQLAIRIRNRETLAFLTWEPWMHNPKLKHRLGRIKAPTLFLRGESDRLISPGYSDAYTRLIPNARSELIPEAGHVLSAEQPQAFVSKIVSFLNA